MCVCWVTGLVVGQYTASFRTGADVVRKPVQLTKLIAVAVQR